MSGSHTGRTVLVTGGSSGLGATFALALARAGARVAVAARRVQRMDALVDEIRQAGGEAMAIALDVTEEASVVAAYDAVAAQFGPIDTVIANAGINVSGSGKDLPLEDYDAIQAVNTRGVFLTVREGGRRMLATSDPARGRILVVASMGGIYPLPELVAYSASKAAAVMLARGFAAEWAKSGICVNVLCPGYMRTEINSEWFDSEAGQRMVARMPRGRLMPIEALIPTALDLTADASGHHTGGVIQINDGQMS